MLKSKKKHYSLELNPQFFLQMQFWNHTTLKFTIVLLGWIHTESAWFKATINQFLYYFSEIERRNERNTILLDKQKTAVLAVLDGKVAL